MTHHLVGMAEIAEMLGVTRQRVAQLIETYEDFPKPEVELSGGRVWSRTAIETWIASHPERGPGRPEHEGRKPRFFGRQSGPMFSRFTDRARNSVVRAKEEARLMRHNFIGTEHLLLGLLAIGEGIAFEVLAGLDVTLAGVREQVGEMIGLGPEAPQGHIPFTPRAKKVLELALREARHLNHNYIGTEHVLLGLIRENEGVAAQALVRLGAEEHQTRAAVMDALEGLTSRRAVPRDTGSDDKCSFCGKTREQVMKLVAGPGVSICDECVALSHDIVSQAAGEESDPVAERLAMLEERISRLEGEPDS